LKINWNAWVLSTFNHGVSSPWWPKALASLR